MAADSEGGGNSEKRESDGEREVDLDLDRGAEQGHNPPPPPHTHTVSVYQQAFAHIHFNVSLPMAQMDSAERETLVQEHFSHTHGLYVSWQRDIPRVNLTGTCGMISSAQSQKSTSKCLNKLQINDNHKLVLLNILFCVNNCIVRENLFINLKKLKHFKINQAVSIK